MAGKLIPNINRYDSVDEIVTYQGGVAQRPFRVTRFLDIIRNDGPGEAVVTLDAGKAIPLDAGDFVGPWSEFQCSTITIQCVTEGSQVRVRGVGV